MPQVECMDCARFENRNVRRLDSHVALPLAVFDALVKQNSIGNA